MVKLSLSGVPAHDINIVEGYVEGDEAILKLEGVNIFSSEKIRGTLNMKKDKGQWKLKTEKWDHKH